jgi:hypothetical protein
MKESQKMEQYLMDKINSYHHEDIEIFSKFYIEKAVECSKQYGEYWIRDLLQKDCHAVFRVSKNSASEEVIDWVGYTSDDTNDDRRNMLINEPWTLMDMLTDDQSEIFVVLGAKAFRYLTIQKINESVEAYIVMDYLLLD